MFHLASTIIHSFFLFLSLRFQRLSEHLKPPVPQLQLIIMPPSVCQHVILNDLLSVCRSTDAKGGGGGARGSTAALHQWRITVIVVS